MSILSLYFLFVLLPNLKYLGIGVVLGSIMLFVALIAWYLIEIEEMESPPFPAPPKLKYCIVGVICGFLLFAGSPTTKQIITIAGINYISNNKEFKKLPENLIRYINKHVTERKENHE